MSTQVGSGREINRRLSAAITESYSLGPVAIFGDLCDQRLQRRHSKSVLEEIVLTCINVH